MTARTKNPAGDSELRLASTRQRERNAANPPPCRGEHELFFAHRRGAESAARKICQTCPIQRTCLEEAIRLDEALVRQGHRVPVSGVWGGATREMLRTLTVKTSRGKKPLRCKCGNEADPLYAANHDVIRCRVCAEEALAA